VARIRPEMVRFRTGRRREFSSLGARCAVRADTASLDCLSLSSLSHRHTGLQSNSNTQDSGRCGLGKELVASTRLEMVQNESQGARREVFVTVVASLTCRHSSNYMQEDMTFCLLVVIHAALK
jgi:hypothetical protein